ncbi:MAG: hypothetical protein RSF68_01765 [Myroides sp.]
MKIFYLAILFIATSTLSAQNKFEEKIDNLLQIEVAVLQENIPILTVNKDDLLETFNHHFQESQNKFDVVGIKQEKVAETNYYYLQLSNSKANRNAVVKLKAVNNKLMFVKESGVRVFICEGYDECYPRFKTNEEGEMYFNCRDIEACVNEEYAEKYPCAATKGAIFY